MISRGTLVASMIIHDQLCKEADAASAARGVVGALKGGYEGAKRVSAATGGALEREMSRAGYPRVGKALKWGGRVLPAAALAYLGYQALKPEVHSVGRRASGAVRSKLRQFEARSYATSPRFAGGRYV